MRRILAATALATLLASPAWAQGDNESFLPTTDMVTHALDQHPYVKQASAMLTAAEADARARRAGPHEFTIDGEYLYRDTQMEGSFNEWYGGISRGIRLPGKAKADRQIGDLGIQVAENGYEDARHQAALTLKNLWMNWLSADSEVSITQAEAETYERELAATERQQQLGERSDLDVEQVRAALSRAQVNTVMALQARQDAAMTLRRTFPDLMLPAQPPALPDPTKPEGSWDDWQHAVIADSHEIRMAQSEAQRRLSLARRARLDRFADPTIGLKGFSERNGQETGIGITFSIPLGGRMRSAQSQALGAQAVAAEVQAAAVTRDIEITAERDVIGAQMGIKAWQQAADALKESERAISRMQRAVELGEQDLTTLLIAQRQHFEVRRGEATARAAAHNAILQLRIDSHRLWGLGDHEGEHGG